MNARILSSLLLVSVVLPSVDPAQADPPRPDPPQPKSTQPESSLRGTLVVLNKSDADVSLIDPQTGETRLRLPVGVGPHEAATAADGKTVVVCNYGERAPGRTLTVLDVAAGIVVKTIDLGATYRPHGIQILPGDRHAVVTGETKQQLLLVDLESGEVEAKIGTGQRGSHMVAVDAAATRAYVANIGSGTVTAMDLEKRKGIDVIKTGAQAEGIAVHPRSGEVWVSNRQANTLSVIDPASNAVVAQLECGLFPIRVAFTTEGNHALVSCMRSNEIAVFDVEERSEVRRVAMRSDAVRDEEAKKRLFGRVSGAAPIGILMEPGGRFAFVANTYADVVTVIDLAKWQVVRAIPTGRQPDGMTWATAVTGAGGGKQEKKSRRVIR